MPLILNWPKGKVSSIFVSEIIKISTLPLVNSAKSPNLFLKELIFRCAIIRLLTCFCAHGIKSSIKVDILRNRIPFLYFEVHPSLLPSILYQWKILDIVLTKLLLKIILPDLIRCSLLLLMFLEWIVLVWSLKKTFFSIQNYLRHPFTSIALSLTL